MSRLTVADLVAGYGNGAVLHGVSLSVAEGSVTVLLGANGAGKTTTLRAISGMIRARGTISLDERSLVGLAPEEVVRRGVAHVPQGRGTFNELTVEENLRVGAHIRRGQSLDADVAAWYGLFPRLADRRGQLAGSLSGGEQQMLALARALMARPSLLLLDEPSLGLAPLVVQQIFEVLAEINRERRMAMLVVEQNAHLALDLARTVYVMESGRIVLSAPPDEIRSDDSVRRAYLGY